MEFSDMIKRCKLSRISDYLLGVDDVIGEREDLSYEDAVRNMERRTEKIIDSHFERIEDRDEFFSEIASRESVITETYFQLGFIAGISIIKDLEKRFKEFN